MTVAWLSWFDTHVFVSTFSASHVLAVRVRSCSQTPELYGRCRRAASHAKCGQSPDTGTGRSSWGRAFVRERQTVRLTAAGQAYAQEIRGSLMRIANATLSFRTNPQGGQLNLAILPTFGTRWLAPRLPQFFRSNRASPLISPRACRSLTFHWKPWMRPSTLVSRTGLVQSWSF